MTGPLQPLIVVCGGGAAGLVAAIFAARGGGRVCVLERTADGGRKILISGGGRCNVLPAALDDRRFVTDSSPNALRKIIRSWPLHEQRSFFERDLRVPLALEVDSQKYFPASHRARDVRDALVASARAAGVDLRFGARVVDVVQAPDRRWWVHCEGLEPLAASAVVLATGGLSVPSTGSDGLGLRLSEKLGHAMQPTYPALTPLLLEPNRFAELAGISTRVALSVAAAQPSGRRLTVAGGFLFTHRGFSGPAVLDASHVAVRAILAGRHEEIFVRWTELDAVEWDALLLRSQGTVAAALRRHLPQRLADTLAREAGVVPGRRLAELSRPQRRLMVDVLTAWRLPYTGHEGYRKAEVTGGGVALSEVDPRTLESRRRQGLFFCGEMLDAFGPIGGYNFAWAWATGRAAGTGAARSRASVG